jgi:hypothetical protein
MFHIRDSFTQYAMPEGTLTEQLIIITVLGPKTRVRVTSANRTAQETPSKC